MGHNHKEIRMATKKSSKKQAKATEQRPAKRKKIVSLAQYEAESKAQKQATPVTPTSADVTPGSKKFLPKSAKASKVATVATGGDTGKRGGKLSGKLSGLDAAAQVLHDAGEPLNTTEMVKRMLDRGLWTTGGKTPAATIYAAVIREIAVKGSQSRFRKTERGKFELAK